MPAGAYAPIPVWSSSDAWLDAVRRVLATDAGEHARRAARVAAGTLLSIAQLDRRSADVATGRGVATAHETVAAALGVCKKTVQRARALLEALGLARTVVPGRYLTTEERTAARRLHGGGQLRAASVRALTIPRSLAVSNVHLPRRGSSSSTSHLSEIHTTRARERNQINSKTSPSRRPPRQARHRPIELQKLAARLAERMPWLVRDRHIGRLCTLLSGAGVDGRRWTATTLLDAVERRHRRTGVTVADPGAQRDPLAYFAWQLRGALVDEHAADIAAADAVARARARAARAEERRREAARMASVDHDEVRRILAQMRADFPRAPRPRSTSAGRPERTIA